MFDFIVSHSPYLANGCLNFKDSYPERQKPRIILVVHGLPKTSQGNIDEKMLEEWMRQIVYFHQEKPNMLKWHPTLQLLKQIKDQNIKCTEFEC